MSIIFGKKKAALIDMDGVLYDSMPGHTLAWKRMMDELGVECSRDEFYLYEGMTGAATIDLLMRRAFGHGVSAERTRELYAVKSGYFKQMGPAPLMPGADRMLEALARGGLDRVLVTGSGQKSLLEALDRDYPGAFEASHRVTAHDVTHGKPNPEPYLRGADKASADPKDTIVIENAPLGVRAGKAAGAFTIAVTTGPIPRKAFEDEGADMIFGSMEAFADFLERDLAEYLSTTEPENSPSSDTSADRVVYCDSQGEALAAWLNDIDCDRTFVITDRNVEEYAGRIMPEGIPMFLIEPGERSKSLATLADIWKWLGDSGATRRSLIVNIGGGVVSDLGGFAAATFKRGVRYVNVPTTLLAAADASIGGKTGIDFNGLKNEVGAFALPESVFVSLEPLATLPRPELLSGFGEVVKMAAISDAALYGELLAGDALSDKPLLARALRHASVEKERIVTLDPVEKGLRRILNFGHTAGHTFEMLANARGRDMSHGEAVAHGMDFALYLSVKLRNLDEDVRTEYCERILNRYYSPLPFGRKDAEELMGLMKHDKKNRCGEEISFVLLSGIGHPEVCSIAYPEVAGLLRRYLPE